MERKVLLKNILDMEWEMFVRVKSSQPAACQSAPDNFRAIRGSVFDVWTDEMLESYLEQLNEANARGRNLLTEKYARMDNLIPPLTDNPLIADIVTISYRWQLELQERYPALYMRCCRGTDPTGDGSNFSIYLSAELETYGDRTVDLYYQNVKNAEEEKRNLSLEALQRLVQMSGYTDLKDAESSLRNETLQS
ncbi:MAG: DUF4125 family protein [Geobacteraceae bacterium]